MAEEIFHEEQALLARHRVHDRLRACLDKPYGVRFFAETFYFVRHDFYRLNFIVGGRQWVTDALWRGLALNLLEELGGESGPSHNELYQRFMASVGAASPDRLKAPPFAVTFNDRWEEHCKSAAFPRAVAAIGIYEVLDVPDYRLLLDVMRSMRVPQVGLSFFRVHARAAHFELFESALAALSKTAAGARQIGSARSFVHRMQRLMWLGLLEHLEGGSVHGHPAGS